MSLEQPPRGEMLTNKPINALLVLGQGIKPQVRGRPGERQVVIGSEYDSQIWRMKLVAAKELAARGLVHGPIITTGSNTANKDTVSDAQIKKQTAIEKAIQRIRDEKGSEFQPEEAELNLELNRMYAALSIVDRNVALHNPLSDDDVALVREMTEARLAASFLKKLAVKPDVSDPVTIPVKVLEEPQARNTTQNILYMLNMLDQTGNGAMWNGTISIITSNNGHLQRADEILQAYGLDESHVVLLSSETILHHYHYREDILGRLEEIHQKEETLRGHLRWSEGVKRMPEYVLSEIAILDNDQRLRSVIGALGRWYKQQNIDIFTTHPTLANYETMEVSKLRENLRAITRITPPEDWKNDVDMNQSRGLIAHYNDQTRAWLAANTT